MANFYGSELYVSGIDEEHSDTLEESAVLDDDHMLFDHSMQNEVKTLCLLQCFQRHFTLFPPFFNDTFGDTEAYLLI